MRVLVGFVRFVVDARVALDLDRRVVNAEAIFEHLLELARSDLRVVQAERPL